MLIFPDWLKPVIYSIPVPFIGQLDIRWYGLMYAVGFLAFWWLGIIHAKKNHTVAKPEEVGDILFYGMLGVILGGRIGSVLFYNFSHFLENPLYLFKIWEGGMSFHGGLLGVIITLGIYQRSKGYGFLRICDFVAPMIPIGLGAGRIGNFINAELWGRVTDVPWGMVFPGDAGPLPRHPSQLYQAFLEGFVMFVVLWIFAKKPRPIGAIAGLFVLLYGVFRFAVEFVREPDAPTIDWLTRGQLLTIPMIIVGLVTMWLAYTKFGIAEKS